MDEVTFRRISYAELKERSIDLRGDDFGIISDYLTESMREALLANPSLYDESKSVLNIICLNGKIVGRQLLMPTSIKVGNCIAMAQSGGGFEINEHFRGLGFGTKLDEDSIKHREYPMHIGQLYTLGGIAVYRKLNVPIFEKPLFVKQCKMRSVLEAKGFKGLALRCCSFLGDIYLKLRNLPNLLKFLFLKKKYRIQRETLIPAWAGFMTINDGHKYMEIHDQKWLQWCLDYKFIDDPRDSNAFFAVYDKNNSPAGFFMIKERFEENKQGVFKNIVRGTVVEWGSRNEQELDEVDLNLMAFFSFGSAVDKINTVISSDGIDEAIKNIGFSYRGNFQVTFLPDDMNESDLLDQSQWRIRFGGANTIFVKQ